MPRHEFERARTANSKVLKRIEKHEKKQGLACFFCAAGKGCNAGMKKKQPRSDRYKNHRAGLNTIPDGHAKA